MQTFIREKKSEKQGGAKDEEELTKKPWGMPDVLSHPTWKDKPPEILRGRKEDSLLNLSRLNYLIIP